MQCPDCGAFCSEEDEFCGECGVRLPRETSGGTATAAVAAVPGPVQDLAADLFEPSLPEPSPVKAKPRKANLLPVLIAVGAALLLCVGATGAIVWFTVQEESKAPDPTPFRMQEKPTVPLPTPLETREQPAATPTATVEAFELGALLYQEDFDGLDSDWSIFAGEDTLLGPADGAYHIAVYRTNWMAWGHPESALDFGDMFIKVDARQVEGSPNSTFGPIIRYDADEERFYWFQISGNGYYSVEKKWEGEWILLQEWEPSAAIKQGLDATNHIQVICDGDHFRFSVNDTLLVELTDDALPAGAVGLAAGAYDEPPVAVVFDNLSVYALEK